MSLWMMFLAVQLSDSHADLDEVRPHEVLGEGLAVRLALPDAPLKVSIRSVLHHDAQALPVKEGLAVAGDVWVPDGGLQTDLVHGLGPLLVGHVPNVRLLEGVDPAVRDAPDSKPALRGR